MFENRRRLSGACWAVAGLPILASFVQATVALLGASASGIPVLGGLKRLFQSVPVFDAAGTVFRASSTVTLVLFVLVTAAWLAQGAGLFLFRHRVMTLGATGLVTLFLVLFELVYLPLLSAGLPTAQVAGFMLVPVVAATASWAGSLVFEWDVTLDEETTERLADARSTAQSALDGFDERIESAVDEQTLSSLRSFAPEAVSEFEDGRSAFRERCQSVVDSAAAVSDDHGASSRERNDRATQILSDAESLDPDRRAERLVEELEESVCERVRSEFGDLHCVSRYGDAYEVRNLRQYNEVSLPTIGGPSVQLGGDQHELADRLVQAVTEQGLGPGARAIERVEDHLDSLRTTLDEREDAVASTLADADDALDLARDHLDALDGDARERLSDYLLEGRRPNDAPEVPNAPAVREAASDAKDALHAGRFDDAERHAERARSTAREVQTVAEFFAESVASTIDYGSGSIPVPDTVGRELVAQLRVPFERSYDVDYEVEGGQLEIATEGGESATTNEPRKPVGGAGRETSGAAPDDVLYVLRELRSTAATTSAEDTVALQTERLPEKFLSSPILDEVKTFAERQSDVVAVTVPDDPPPGYLSVEVADDVSPQRVMEELQDQYASAQ